LLYFAGKPEFGFAEPYRFVDLILETFLTRTKLYTIVIFIDQWV